MLLAQSLMAKSLAKAKQISLSTQRRGQTREKIGIDLRLRGRTHLAMRCDGGGKWRGSGRWEDKWRRGKE